MQNTTMPNGKRRIIVKAQPTVLSRAEKKDSIRTSETRVQERVVRRVLLFGMKTDSNNYSHYLRRNWLDIVHVPYLTNRDFPQADAAIIAIDQCAHELMWKAKEFCKKNNIRFFEAQDGISKVKEEFENFVFGKQAIEKIQGSNMTFESKLAYCLVRFYKPGDVIDIKVFKKKLENFIDLQEKDQPDNGVGNFFQKNKAPARGIVTHTARGQYIFNGLRGYYYNDLKSYGLVLPVQEGANKSPLSKPFEGLHKEKVEEKIQSQHIPPVEKIEPIPEVKKTENPIDELVFETLHTLLGTIEALRNEFSTFKSSVAEDLKSALPRSSLSASDIQMIEETISNRIGLQSELNSLAPLFQKATAKDLTVLKGIIGVYMKSNSDFEPEVHTAN